MSDHGPSIFIKCAKYLLPCDKKSFSHSFKELSQIPLLIDTLSRQKRHHLLLMQSSSQKWNDVVIQSLAECLPTKMPSYLLQKMNCLYFDVTAFILNPDTIDHLENDFRILYSDIQTNKKHFILIINQLEPLLHAEPASPLGTAWKLFTSILTHPQWRLIVLVHPTTYEMISSQNTFLNHLFTPIQLNEPTETESLSILKNERVLLEQFHNVIISEEIIPSALSLANTYLPGNSSLDKTFELLDSAAARAGLPHDASDQKSILTSMHLAEVISSWTHIPLSHLQTNKFQMGKLIESLQRFIFSQDSAIQTIAAILQNACIKLHRKPGPLCSFLLAGPASTGKASLVYALSEHLFGHSHALLRVNSNKTSTHLSHLTVTTGLHNERSVHLLTAIQETPYACLFFENIDRFTDEMLYSLNFILTHGYIVDEQGKKYDFHHAIIIISTTVGAEHIIRLTQTSSDKHKQIDLMQLVLNEHVQDPSLYSPQSLSPLEMTECILPELMTHFSKELLEKVNLIPFAPLDYTALEKIVRNKLKSLTKRLESSFGIELHYAPEIIKFLAHDVLWQRTPLTSFDKLLEQTLYSCVSHEILAHMEDKHKPKQLLLQLNDNGQLLRCEFITSNEATLYHL
jgi:ATP-dependent Clp protease ATP-binding subunit ClpC